MQIVFCVYFYKGWAAQSADSHLCVATPGSPSVTIINPTEGYLTSAYETEHFHLFNFGCKFGFILTCVAIVVNLIQIGLRCAPCEILFNCLASVMMLVFLAFLIMTCVFAYPKGAR